MLVGQNFISFSISFCINSQDLDRLAYLAMRIDVGNLIMMMLLLHKFSYALEAHELDMYLVL